MQYGLFHRLRTRFFAGLVAKKQEKEDNLFRLPSSPVQIYNIFRPKANSVKIMDLMLRVPNCKLF